MTVKDLIESGYIELYVMNALPEEESIHLERMALSYPELRVEIEKVEAALHALANKQAVTPRPSLKAEILDNIDAGDAVVTTNNNNLIDSVSSTPQKPSLHLLQFLPYMLLLLLGTATFYFYSERNKTLAEQSACAVSDRTKQEEIARLNHTIDILRDPNTKFVQLKGLKLSPQAKVMVFWNKTTKETFLNIADLPQPPPDKQYQLWAIVKTKPVDAGVFDLDFQKVQRMKDFDTAEAFAVTLEDKGGSPTPNLEKMYAMGAL